MTNLEGFSAFGLPIVVKPITEDYGDDVTTVTSSWVLQCIDIELFQITFFTRNALPSQFNRRN